MALDQITLNGLSLVGLDRLNILLGKNGCGKSRALKLIEGSLRGRPETGAIRYLSPERGGLLSYNPGVDQNMSGDRDWLPNTRRRNQVENFRVQSAAQYRRLELLRLREIEKDPKVRQDPSAVFDTTLDRINALLDRVIIERSDPIFSIRDKSTGTNVAAADLSSGEAELISLGIETLVFERECQDGKQNVLLVDEPDVHLHPDLQSRFARFLSGLAQDKSVTILIATHSTALVASLAADPRSRLAFMRYGDSSLMFAPPTEIDRRLLPIFGAHPLSNVFNEAPALLVEGEDDERVWQQAVRSSQGQIRIYPCGVDGVSELHDYELEVSRILATVYDNGTAFSLRDRDDAVGPIDDLDGVRRMRLGCRAAENMFVSDDVLARIGTPWPVLRDRIEAWLASNSAHVHYAAMKAFADGGFDRVLGDIKEVRNDLVGLAGSNKPWEVLVGQAIAVLNPGTGTLSPTGLQTMLGAGACQHLLRFSPPGA